MRTILLIVAVAVGIIIWFGFLIRNWRLYRFRIGLIDSDFYAYLRLPSYASMFWRFWRPMKSFLKESR